MLKYSTVLLVLPLLLACAQPAITVKPYTPGQSFFYDDDNFLNYEVIGRGPMHLVFIHGFGASLQTWNDILPFFDQSRYTLVLVDLKGSGFSSKPEHSDYSMAGQKKIILQFLQHLNLTSYYLIGHSFGGGVVLLTALDLINNPDIAPPSGLILIDAAAYKTELPFFVQYLRIPLFRQILLHALSAGYQARYTLDKLFYEPAEITPDLIYRYSFFIQMKGYGNALIQTAEQIVPPDFEQYTKRYKTIPWRSLVVWGREDPALPLWSGKKLARGLGDAELAIIDRSGHNTQEEQPALAADRMLQFLQQEGRDEK